MGKKHKEMKNQRNENSRGHSRSGKTYRKPVLALIMLLLFSAVIVLDLVNVQYGGSLTHSNRQMSSGEFAPGNGQPPQVKADAVASDAASSDSAASDSAASDSDQAGGVAEEGAGQRPQMKADKNTTDSASTDSALSDSAASDSAASGSDQVGGMAEEGAGQRPQMNVNAAVSDSAASDSAASDSDQAGEMAEEGAGQRPQMGPGGDRSEMQEVQGSSGIVSQILSNTVIHKIMTTARMYWVAILCVAVAADLLVIFYLASRHNRIKKEKAQAARLAAIRAENGEDEDDDDYDDDEKYARRRPVRAAMLPLCLVLAVATVIYQLPTVQSDSSLMTVEARVVSAQAEAGTVTSTLTGSGSLSGESTVNLSIPSGVTVETYFVSNGDVVESGDLLATVNKTSVEEAIVTLQTAIDDLDADLEADEEAEQEITATASGTVKAIFAEAGDAVTDVMEEYGALMLISLDGSMEVDIDAQEGLSIGSKVIVVLSDGTEETGRVAQIEDGIAKITLPDDSASYQEEVTVKDSEGNEIGSGTLSIHSCLKVTGYYGEVYAVNTSVDSEVSSGDQLLDITDANTAASSEILLDTRAKLEVKMAELYALREDPCIYAQLSGVVSGIPEDSSEETANSMDADNDEEAADSTAAVSDEEAADSTVDDTTAETSGVVAEEADKTAAEDTAVQAAAETAAPETAAPETAAPETAAPETQAPETKAPETQAPETQAPETAAPETQAAETTAPETQATETSTTEAKAAETQASETKTTETNTKETKTTTTEKSETSSQGNTSQTEKTNSSEDLPNETAVVSTQTEGSAEQTDSTIGQGTDSSQTSQSKLLLSAQAEEVNTENTTQSESSQAGSEGTTESETEEEETEETETTPADGSYYGYVLSIDSNTKTISIRYAENKSGVSAANGTKYSITMESLDGLSEGSIISFTCTTTTEGENTTTNVSDLTVLLPDGTYAAKVTSVSGNTVTVTYASHTASETDAVTLSSEVEDSADTYTFTTESDVSGLSADSMILLTVTGREITFEAVSSETETQSETESETESEDSTESSETASSTESSQTSDSTESSETSDSTESSETSDSTESSETSDSTESSETSGSTESSETSDSTESSETSSSSGSGSSSGTTKSDGNSTESTTEADSSSSENDSSKSSSNSSQKEKSSSGDTKGSSKEKSSSESESESSAKSKKSSSSGSTPGAASAKSGSASGSGSGAASGGSASGGSASGGSAVGTTAEAAIAEAQEQASYDLYDLEDDEILTVAPQNSMTITIEADELDILALREGQSAVITLDALEGRSFTGIVTCVDLTGTNEGGNTKYTATITLDKTDEMLEGMNASVRIETESADTAVTVPAQALVEQDGKTFVYTTYDEKTDTLGGLQEIETGVSDGITVEVTDGLEEGQDYYYRYAETVDYTFS